MINMIKKPKLKPRPGMVEIEHRGRRMYRDVKTGEIKEMIGEAVVKAAETEQTEDEDERNG